MGKITTGIASGIRTPTIKPLMQEQTVENSRNTRELKKGSIVSVSSKLLVKCMKPTVSKCYHAVTSFKPWMICFTWKRCSCCRRLASVDLGAFCNLMSNDSWQVGLADRKNSRDSKKVKFGYSIIKEFTSKWSELLLSSREVDSTNRYVTGLVTKEH